MTRAKQHMTPVSKSDDLQVARQVLETEAQALHELAARIDARFQQALDLMAAAEGRVVVTGMGKSGHVARKIAATMASTGTPAFFVHPAEASHGDMGMIVRGDVVVALSNSGEVRELQDLIEYTRRFAIPLIAITSGEESSLAKRADVVLLLPPSTEACPNGLAPTTSTTMALALGDALAVALLARKGFTANDFKVFHPGGKLGKQLMEVAEIMHTGDKLPVAAETVSLRSAIDIMTEKGFGCIALTDTNGKLSGIITDGDLRRHFGVDISGKLARDIMSKNPRTAYPDMLVGETVAIMNDLKNSFHKITTLIIVDKTNAPVGILHIHDCLRAGFA